MSTDWMAAAVTAISTGGVVGVPTDTVYGIAVDLWNEGAVGSLFELKGRPDDKPVGLLAASRSQVEEIADLAVAADLADAHWPGALTLVVRSVVVIPDWIGNASVRSIGVRVPDHDDLRALLTETGPLAVTSANRSGEAETLDDDAARAVFGVRVVFYVPGRCRGGVASTVVDATGPSPVVLRPGPVEV
ncbi:MAG: L-threonylcarbamoyladenylate synthase [Acidimicrobiia bacterium]